MWALEVKKGLEGAKLAAENDLTSLVNLLEGCRLTDEEAKEYWFTVSDARDEGSVTGKVTKRFVTLVATHVGQYFYEKRNCSLLLLEDERVLINTKEFCRIFGIGDG